MLVLLSASIAALSGCGADLDEQGYLDRANDRFADERYRDAIIDYRNVLRENADNSEARAGLGLAYKREHDFDSAVTHLERALEEGAPPERVVVPLARALFESGRGADLADLPAPDDLDPTQTADLYAYRALGAIQRADREKAQTYLERAQGIDEELPSVLTAEAIFAVNDGDWERAEQASLAAIEKDPEMAPAWSVRAQASRVLGDLAEAEEHYDRFLDLRPGMVAERFARGQIRLERGDLDGAEADASVLTEGAPDHPAGHYLMGLVLWEQGERSESRRHFEDALSAAGGFRAPRPYLAAINLERDNLSQAEHHLERFHATGRGNEMSHQLYASLRVAQGRPEAAVERLSRAVEEQPELFGELAGQLAALHMEAGESEQAIEILREAVERDPERSDHYEMLGVALLQEGFDEEGLGMLEQAAERSPQARGSEWALTAAHLQGGRFEQAADAAERLMEKEPESAEAHNLYAIALLGQGRLDDARDAFGRGLELDPGNPGMGMNLSTLEMARGDVEQAQRALERVQDEYPGHVDSGVRLASLMLAQGESDAASERLAVVVDRSPEALQPRLMLGRLHLELGELGRAAAVLRGGLEGYGDRPELLFALAEVHERKGEHQQAKQFLDERLELGDPATADALYALGRNQWALGEHEAAETSLREALELAPDQRQVRHLLASIQLQRGNHAGAQEQYEQLVETDSNDVAALNNLAWVLKGRDLERAEQYAQQAHDLAPDQPDVLDTLGAILLERGDSSRALEILNRAWEQAGEDNPVIGYHLARAHFEVGEVERAEALVSRVLDEHGDFEQRGEAERLLQRLQG